MTCFGNSEKQMVSKHAWPCIAQHCPCSSLPYVTVVPHVGKDDLLYSFNRFSDLETRLCVVLNNNCKRVLQYTGRSSLSSTWLAIVIASSISDLVCCWAHFPGSIMIDIVATNQYRYCNEHRTFVTMLITGSCCSWTDKIQSAAVSGHAFRKITSCLLAKHQ